MARYTFTCEHFEYDLYRGDENGVASKHTTEFRADTLETMLENFELFLRGAGFHFDGVLEVVESDDDRDAEEDLRAIDDFVTGHQSERVMDHVVKDLMRQNDQKESVKLQDEFGDIFVSNENILIDHGAAQPVYTVATEDDSQLSFTFDLSEYSREFSNDEYCSLCKLPISVMNLHQCFDPSCPTGAYRNQYAN